MIRFRVLMLAFACSLPAACAIKPDFINEYKIDVQQGNVLTQEMVGQLRPGQTRDQVRFLLGTPMVTDLFHERRWDYTYRYQNGKTGQIEQRGFSAFFDDQGRLERVAGAVEAADADALGAPVARNRLLDLGSVSADTPLPPPEQPGYWARMMNFFGF